MLYQKKDKDMKYSTETVLDTENHLWYKTPQQAFPPKTS